jgi:oxygen-independent coproporphyrinogen-3 oxidase
MVLREILLDAGYVQTTLTNFERKELVETPRGYLYERCNKRPETYDMVGFGVSGISLYSDGDSLMKYANQEDAIGYRTSVGFYKTGVVADVFFDYQDPHDHKILHLTRRVATLGVSREDYAGQFRGADPVVDFPEEFAVFFREGLVDPDTLALTPGGMFYADTVAGTLAWRRVRQVQNMRNEAVLRFMG